MKKILEENNKGKNLNITNTLNYGPIKISKEETKEKLIESPSVKINSFLKLIPQNSENQIKIISKHSNNNLNNISNNSSNNNNSNNNIINNTINSPQKKKYLI